MLRKTLGIYNTNSVLKSNATRYLSTVPKLETEEQTTVTEILKENEILRHPDYFKVSNLFTVKDLFNARVHYGHKITSLVDNMKPFVFGSRLGHVIFDLDETADLLRRALNITAHIAYRGGIVLFVSSKPEITLLVEDTAQRCKEYAVAREWRLGTFTDSKNKFKTHVRLPDLCIVLNTLEEAGNSHFAVVEAAKMSIPTVGIVDSNCDPNLITYPVPGNDDSYSSLSLYCKLFCEAILRGKREREKHVKELSERMDNDLQKFLTTTPVDSEKVDDSLDDESHHMRRDRETSDFDVVFESETSETNTKVDNL